MKRIAYFLLIAVVLVGCKSSKRLTADKGAGSYCFRSSYSQLSGFQTSADDSG